MLQSHLLPLAVPEHSCLYSVLPPLLKRGDGDPVQGADLAESQWLVHDFTSDTATVLGVYSSLGFGWHQLLQNYALDPC